MDASCNEEITLDNWKPSTQKKHIQKSEWREKQNNGDFNQSPGIDELYKINMYLKKKYPDSEIMDVFGITSETLVAIKRNCYDPIDGISLDNQSKIYKEFVKVNKKLSSFYGAFKLLADTLDIKDESIRLTLKAIIGKPEKKKKEDIEDEEE